MKFPDALFPPLHLLVTVVAIAAMHVGCGDGKDDPADAGDPADGGPGADASTPLLGCPDPAGYSTSTFTRELIDPFPLLDPALSLCSGPVAVNGNSPCVPHLMYTPTGDARTPLVVFLPGSNMEPNKHEQMHEIAAYAGYRTIGLSYDNIVSTQDACAARDSCADGCRSLVREEVATGIDVAPMGALAGRNVLFEDGVLPRLYRALRHAATLDPDYNAYLAPEDVPGEVDVDDILWENIIVAGFSQGAGVAAWLSRNYPLHGILMFDGGADQCTDASGASVPANWFNGADVSAGRPKFVVYHARGLPQPSLHPSFVALGLSGTPFELDDPALDVIDQDPPSPASYTNHTPPPGVGAHGSMARVESMPTDFAGTDFAVEANEARLFAPYLLRFCHACDATTCPR